MVRFLQWEELGYDDYTEERQKWLGDLDLNRGRAKDTKGESSQSPAAFIIFMVDSVVHPAG